MSTGAVVTEGKSGVDLYNEAVAAHNAGHHERALKLLEAAILVIKNPDLRATAEAALVEGRGEVEYNRVVARFNEAVEMANAGRRAEALAAIQALMAEAPPDALRPQIQQLLEALQARRR